MASETANKTPGHGRQPAASDKGLFAKGRMTAQGKRRPAVNGKHLKAKKAKPTKPAKIKYCKVRFSISEKERDALLKFCERDGIALKALYKKAVRLYVKERSEQMDKEEALSENQLDLFKPIPYQTKLNF